jgi:archaeal type IV pilus assembly protein PilA
MDLRKRSVGVSPIIATLLLIAITVAAGVIVYVFVSGIGTSLTQGGGQQVAQQIELTAYAFTPLTGSSITCNGNTTLTAPCIIVSIKDVGGSSVTIDTVLFDAVALTPAGTLVTTPITLSTNQDASFLLIGSGTFTTGHGGFTGLPSGITGGTTHVLKFVTKNGGLFAYTITAGTSQ